LRREKLGLPDILLGESLYLFPDEVSEIDAGIEVERRVPACAVALEEVGLSSVAVENSAAGDTCDFGHVLIAHVWHVPSLVYFEWAAGRGYRAGIALSG
jgi:hypothetical protein